MSLVLKSLAMEHLKCRLFMKITHVQGWNSYNQSLTAYEMGVYGWVVDAQFVIALGDNFYNDGTESTEDELWQTAFHDIYGAPSLNVPWYGVLGNHGNTIQNNIQNV